LGREYVRIRALSARLTTGSVRNEAALLARVVARDQSALGELYDMYSRLLFGLILRILKNRDEAEEVLQEVFVQAWMRADTYQPSSGSPAGWLVGIARNRAIDRLRANNVRARALDAPALPAAQESPESQASFAEQQLAVYRALDALPPEQRDLIEQAYFLGFTHSELAARCSLPLGTVKTRIRDGMRALRDRLEATVDG
jgi:RNA polymerase sigma-70 factor (ECF subfamily)